MKKLLSILLAAMLVFSLAACTTPSENTSNPASTPESTPVESGDTGTGEGGELTVWCWDPAFNLYAMEEAEKVYQKDHPDFKLNIVETPWDDIQTKITTAATSGDLSTLPDIFLMQNMAFTKNVTNFPDVFTDLTDSGIAFDQFGESVVGYSKVDGKNYGVPFDNGTAVAAYRTDVLEEAGFTIDDLTDITWDRFIEIGKEVKAKTGKAMHSSTAGSPDLISMMLQSCGISFFNDDETPNIGGNADIEKCVEIYTEMIKEGILIEVNDWDQYIGSFINDEVVGTMNGCWILASVQTAEDQSGKWAITNLPKVDAVSGSSNYSANGGSSWGVSSSSKNADLAKDFLSKTFAGSVELYETILPASGAIANYLPAGESTVYEEPQAFFADQPIYAKIVEMGSSVPSINTGVYYYEARDALGVVITNVINGADIASELDAAQSTVEFAMGG